MTGRDDGQSASGRTTGSWWQTLPGVLTALGGVISAVAALVVALNGLSSSRTPEPNRAPTTATPAAVSSTVQPETPQAGTPVTQSATQASVGRAVAAPQEAALSGRTLLMKIAAARVDPFNAETRLLRLTLRITNNGNSFTRSYYWTYRLIVDGSPRAPEDSVFEQIEGHSAKDVDYVFKVPATPGRVTLRITNDAGELAELPIDLTAG